MRSSKHLRLRVGLHLCHVKGRDVYALAVIATTVTRSVVVNDAGERDKPRPRDVVDAMYEDERKRKPEYCEPKKEVHKKRIIWVPKRSVTSKVE